LTKSYLYLYALVLLHVSIFHRTNAVHSYLTVFTAAFLSSMRFSGKADAKV
jgi:hypothetical protein